MAIWPTPKSSQKSLPTRSPAVTPTRLLAEPTTPVVVPSWLTQVTAPRLLFHNGLNNKDLPEFRL